MSSYKLSKTTAFNTLTVCFFQLQLKRVILCTALMWRNQPTPNQRLYLAPINTKLSCASSALVPKPK